MIRMSIVPATCTTFHVDFPTFRILYGSDLFNSDNLGVENYLLSNSFIFGKPLEIFAEQMTGYQVSVRSNVLPQVLLLV